MKEPIDPAPGKRTVVFFDYDDTLVKGDSLWPFLVAVAGWPRACIALSEAIVGLIWALANGGDHRTYVKERLLQRLLAGKRMEELAPAVEKMLGWPRERGLVMNALREHHDRGNHIVIASGSLSLYLPALLRKVPHHAVLCTDMEIKDGVVTGRMASGNCVRARKAERVADYLLTHGPFDDSWGYGNAPNDLPMLEKVKHRVVA
ncbi:MAG: HAD-IB family phosphatase [Alphaproteobacteria bacterium]|nr:HAD-IB family phosphatase [Alphaproteobacteria bacterium]